MSGKLKIQSEDGETCSKLDAQINLRSNSGNKLAFKINKAGGIQQKIVHRLKNPEGQGLQSNHEGRSLRTKLER